MSILWALLAVVLCAASAKASDYTLRTETLPANPPNAYDDYTRLARDAHLLPSSMASDTKRVYGSTPKWDRFQGLVVRLVGAQRAAERGQGQNTNLMAMAIQELGAPDWVERTCGRYAENQCEAVLAGAAGPDAQQTTRAALIGHVLTWFNGPCRPIELHFTSGLKVPVQYRIRGFGPWALIVDPPKTNTTACVSGGFAYPNHSHPVDYYSCRHRPGRTGCAGSTMLPD
jgi:hypothetical protein